MSAGSQSPRWYGPWLVALGAVLWGTEMAWRIPLNKVLDPVVIVFHEHVLLVALFLPFLLGRLGELRRVPARAIAYLVFSGAAGSAVGAVLYTAALKHGNATVVNLMLNVQPVLTTVGAVVLFKERLARGFFLWAPLAILAGAVISFDHFDAAKGAIVSTGTWLALLCATAWGLSTVAGRGVMTAMSLPLAAGLRVIVGLVTMTILLAVRGQLDVEHLWPAAARAEPLKVGLDLFLLGSLSGALPLVIYFRGLALTRASTAGYFEMLQTITAVVIGLAFFNGKLAPHQVVGAVVLLGAVVMVQRAQQKR